MNKFFQWLNNVSLCWRTVIRPYRWKFTLQTVLNVVSSSLEALSIGLAVPILNGLMNPSSLATNPISVTFRKVLIFGGFPTSENTIIFSMVAFVCVMFFVRSFFMFIDRYTSTQSAEKIYRVTKGKLFDRMLGMEYGSITQRNRGALLSDVAQPSENIFVIFVALSRTFLNALNMIFLFGLMLYLSFKMTLVMVVCGCLVSYLWKRFLPNRAKTAGAYLYELKRLESQVQVDTIDGIKVVKACGLRKEMFDQQNKFLWKQMEPMSELIFLREGAFLANETVASIVVLGLGIVTFFIPQSGLTFPVLVSIMISMRRVVPAITVMTNSLVEINKNRRGLEIIEEFELRTPQEREGGLPVPAILQTIALRSASFYYDARPDHWIFKNLTLNLRRGTVTAVVGSSGAGKSTIANVIMGLYDPREGDVVVNDQPLQTLNLQSYREKIGYISQDIFLFNASIEDNITLWKKDISKEDLIRATQLAQLHDFISSLPQGYQTMVGDRGVRLSGGQCQRVAIARAILRKPQVLIFDEATSALDNITEKVIYQAIEKLRSEAIVLVIAHRLSTIKDADEIIVLKDGRVVETGRHEDLLSNQQIYSQLYFAESKST